MRNFKDYFEIHFRKWSASERFQKKKKLKKGKRGTNFKQVLPKKGYKRIKLTGTNGFIRVRMTPTEKRVKKIIGTKLGKKTF